MQQFQNAKDKQIYEYLCRKDQTMEDGEIKSKTLGFAFITHIIFKVLALLGYYLNAVFHALLTEMITIQLILIFIVADFWFTKNVNGRKMLGLRWSFGQDQFEVERFKFQCRINSDYVNGISTKLFWIIQLVYIIIPAINLGTIIIIAPNLYLISLRNILINLGMLIGGVSNFFFFWKASGASSQRQVQLQKIYGSDFLRKLEDSTIISYL